MKGSPNVFNITCLVRAGNDTLLSSLFFRRPVTYSVYRYERPSWFEMSQGGGGGSGITAVTGGRREKYQTVPRPLSNFDTHPLG